MELRDDLHLDRRHHEGRRHRGGGSDDPGRAVEPPAGRRVCHAAGGDPGVVPDEGGPRVRHGLSWRGQQEGPRRVGGALRGGGQTHEPHRGQGCDRGQALARGRPCPRATCTEARVPIVPEQRKHSASRQRGGYLVLRGGFALWRRILRSGTALHRTNLVHDAAVLGEQRGRHCSRHAGCGAVRRASQWPRPKCGGAPNSAASRVSRAAARTNSGAQRPPGRRRRRRAHRALDFRPEGRRAFPRGFRRRARAGWYRLAFDSACCQV
mmetsp:Transcript_19368/g.58288  ORF Transcript_19368/g.58288 Transcript_19368/m.58288 type:complete len:266 (+) Transcript_19368:945-1742(+)